MQICQTKKSIWSLFERNDEERIEYQYFQFWYKCRILNDNIHSIGNEWNNEEETIIDHNY